jgi:hypothetical protein
VFLLLHAAQFLHNMAFLRKLKFWRKRTNIVTDFEKRIEDLDKLLATLEENLIGHNSKSEHVDTNLRVHTIEPKGKSQVSKREKEETNRRPIKQVKRESRDPEAVEELEKKLEGSDGDSKHVESAPNRQIEELGNRLTEKEKLEAILRGRVQELESKLQERDAEKEQLVTWHHAKFNWLKKKMMETGGERATLEAKFNRKIRELEEQLQEAHIMKNEAESALISQTEYYKSIMKAKDAVREQVEVALFDTSKELEERVRAARTFGEVFRRMCEDFNGRIREANSEKDIAISRMERLENDVRKKDRDKEAMEANLRCEIKQLSEKLRTTEMHHTEVEAALHSKIEGLKKQLRDKKQRERRRWNLPFVWK